MQMCFIFLLLFIFNSVTKEMPGGGNGSSGTAVFRENLVAICSYVRMIGICGLDMDISMDISMDIHGKSVDMDMDMDMDGKFHIHGKQKPAHRAARIFAFLALSPDTSSHCKITDTGLMHRAMCLFASQLLLVYFFAPASGGRGGQAELT